MGKKKAEQADDYKVGYRNPPKATQFKPGQSGNPKGRPKGIRPVGALLQDIIHQKVAVTEGGKTRRIPALEVMLRRLANDAMRSDQKAIKLLLSLVDRYAESPEAALQLRGLLDEDEAILAQYLREPHEVMPTPVSQSSEEGESDAL
jgi:hypothetical protein